MKSTILHTFLIVFFFCISLIESSNITVQGALRIDEIEPNSVIQGNNTQINITGSEFFAPLTVTLRHSASNIQRELSANIISDTNIQAIIPRDLEAGLYSLCISAVETFCLGGFNILSNIQPEIRGIKPSEIFNTQSTEINISGINLDQNQSPTDTAILIGDTSIAITEILTNSIKTMIPSGINPGVYFPQISILGVQSTNQTITLTINAPIEATIASVDPTRIVRFPENDLIFDIQGKNLSKVMGVSAFPSGCIADNNSLCELLEVNDSQILLRVAASNFEDVGSKNWNLIFLDGSEISLPEIEVFDRITPWNGLSWASFITVILLSNGFMAASYFLIAINHEKYKKNLTVPGISGSRIKQHLFCKSEVPRNYQNIKN